ncbi:MAG TPA: type II toxin-antitoxin system VapC family toxin [Candidatus Lokiarchaeia archaeon]
MSTTVTIDTSAWIEYFAGTPEGMIVKKYIDENANIFTPSICLMEIKNKYMREGHKFQDQIEFICNISSIIDLSKEIALKGADIKSKFNLYSIDAIIYASSQIKKSTLLTGDHHFKDLKNVEILS